MKAAWNQYSDWEQDQEELDKVKTRYEEAAAKLAQYEHLEENFEAALIKMQEQADITEMLNFLKILLPEFAGENFNYIQLYFERVLPLFTLNSDLWRLYVIFAKNICKKQSLRQRILERALKNCYHQVDFWIDYMLEIEK